MSDKIALSLSIKATAHLAKSVAKELTVEDPSQEKVAAILKGEDEDTKRHDGEGSSTDN
jgi:hypothetical protein|tara:strand:- start:3910 stop:4086 length:177 start_codon:yes stop_codon:yes gene_type:complete